MLALPQRARMTAKALGIIFSHNSVDAEKKLLILNFFIYLFV